MRDYSFSKGFALPFVVWVIFYSLIFVNVIKIERPPDFINSIYFAQAIGFVVFIHIWYVMCNFKCLDKQIAWCFKEEKADDGDETEDKKDGVNRGSVLELVAKGGQENPDFGPSPRVEDNE